MFTRFMQFTIGQPCNKQYTTELNYLKQNNYEHPNSLGNLVAITKSLD